MNQPKAESKLAVEQSSQKKRRKSLTDQVLSGLLWLFAGKGAQMVFRTIVLMILSRLLVPDDFGIVAAAMVVINFVETVSHLGIGPAITQRVKLTDEHVRTGFTFSMLVGATLFLTAPLHVPIVAKAFNMPELESVLYVISILFPLKSLGLVTESLMIRELRFHLTTRIDIASYVIGYGAIGIVLAYLGFGSWALIYGTLAQTGLRSLLLIVFQPHPKRPQLDRAAFKELFLFGGGFTLARIGNTLALQGDNFVIGRWLGPAALGLYGRAYQLMVTPASLFGTVLDKVLFPAMAKLQNDRERLAMSYERGVAVVALLTLPASVLLYIAAPEIVRVVLGAGWEGVVAPFRILVFGTVFRTSYKISDSIARATGAVYQRAWRQAAYAALVFAGAWIGQHWGLEGVAIGVTFALTINFLMMAHLSLQLTGLTWREFSQVHVPALLLSLTLALVTLPLNSFLRATGINDFVVLLFVLVAGGLLTLMLMWKLPTVFLGPFGVWARDVVLGRALRKRRGRPDVAGEGDIVADP